ncbi:hypothetical protein ACJMK2_004369, partial [Sinanodonta woodiana]
RLIAARKALALGCLGAVWAAVVNKVLGIGNIKKQGGILPLMGSLIQYATTP